LILKMNRCYKRGFPGNLLGSWALRWRVPEMVFGAAVSGDALLGC
jgi:hypothetical protein